MKSRLLAGDYQWPRTVILMKPPLRFVRCSTVIACCFSSWMNTRAVFNADRGERVWERERESVCVCVCAYECVSEWEGYLKKKKKEKRVRLSNSVEKSSGSYYSVVFNWDLIDPSIIHRDCQWAVYAVYATSVSLSFPRILTTKYNLWFFCVVLHFYLFLPLRHPLIFLTLSTWSCKFHHVTSYTFTAFQWFYRRLHAVTVVLSL